MAGASEKKTIDRSRFRNPTPPPGYVRQGKPTLKLKDGLVKVDGVICQFIQPMLEMNVFEMEGDYSKFIVNSDSEDEEMPLKEEKEHYIDHKVHEEDLQAGNCIQENSKKDTQDNLDQDLSNGPHQAQDNVEQSEIVGAKGVEQC